MENQRKKLRLEDIKVESFVTSDALNAQTIQGGTYFNSGCCGSAATIPVLDGGCGTGTGGGGGADTAGVCTQRCGTNVPNCTGVPVCASNTACPDATCADGSWCCPPDSMNATCNAYTCNSGCPGCQPV